MFNALLVNAQRFEPGLQVGLVTSQVDGDTHAGFNKIGLQAGGTLQRKLSEKSPWSFGFEINYIQKGSRRVPQPDKGIYTEYHLNLNYAEVPVMLSFAFGTKDSAGMSSKNFVIYGGLAAGSLVYSKEEDAFGVLTGGRPFRKTEFSLLAGLRYKLTQRAGFDIRTQYSLFPVRDAGSSGYQPNWIQNYIKPGYYNNLLVFCLNYRF